MARKAKQVRPASRTRKPPVLKKREEGPTARREDFVLERFSQLVPNVPDDALAAPVPLDAGPAEGPPAEALNRQALMRQYRARQQTQSRPNGDLLPAAAPILADVPAPTAQPPTTQDQAAANQLFGVADEEEEESDEDGAMAAPPLPPPANNWVPIGPSVVRRGQGDGEPSTSGRILGIAVAADGRRVYAATSNGGVWRSDNAGRAWRSLMDAWDLNPTARATDSLSCGSIAIDPADPDRIFVGSGDGAEALFLGVGPIVSTDGGANWDTESSAPGSPSLVGSAMSALVIDPTRPERVLAGTFLGLYRREPNPAGGFHWARKNIPGGKVTSVVAAQIDDGVIFYAAAAVGPVFTSSDGDTWTVAGAGFPTTQLGCVGLAIHARNPQVVYALVATANGALHGIWRLDRDDGQWRPVNGAPSDLFGTPTIGFQGTYDLAIAIDPNRDDLIYVGGSTRKSGAEWSGCVYRCVISTQGSPAAPAYQMTTTYIGGRVHADSHCLVFAPGDSNKLWLGCDGGAFYSTNPSDGDGHFVARNAGLQTLEMNRLAQHPTEAAVVFCGTQDNGGVRFTGEAAWYHSVWGDCGDFVIDWANPYRVLATYVRKSVNLSTNGGLRYNYVPKNVPARTGDDPLFYAPLASTPPSAVPGEAGRVAFGSRSVWISETFGGGWKSIPTDTPSDNLGSPVRALHFASYTKLYAGTTAGQIFRFTHANNAWTVQRLDNAPGGAIGLHGVVTSIAVDPADATGDAIYVTFGGTGSYQHVWHFDGARWAARSGPSAGNLASLLDVQHNVIACDPVDVGVLYVGADIGVWRSVDSGQTWSPFSDGLPDAAVLDLEVHPRHRLLRAATYGRGVYEINLNPPDAVPGIELYVRDTHLDQGRAISAGGGADPTRFGQVVRPWCGPDIQVDTPDQQGRYQATLLPDQPLNFEEFTNLLSDDFRQVATPASPTAVTRVYVQVHNRGVLPANDVRVTLLLANASAGLPSLPAGFAAQVQSGAPINTADWQTVGTTTVQDVRVGFPEIACFDLPAQLLPPPNQPAGTHHYCLLALVHHNADPCLATQTVVDLLSPSDRKVAHKNHAIVQSTSPQPVMLPFRLHNPLDTSEIQTTLRITLPKIPGRVRLYMPKLTVDGELKQLVAGGKVGQDFADFAQIVAAQKMLINDNLASPTPYHQAWSQQRLTDLKAASESGVMVELNNSGLKPFVLPNLKLAPASYHPFFLVFDRPTVLPGSFFPLEIEQLAANKGTVIGGLSARLEVIL